MLVFGELGWGSVLRFSWWAVILLAFSKAIFGCFCLWEDLCFCVRGVEGAMVVVIRGILEIGELGILRIIVSVMRNYLFPSTY